MGGQFSRYRYLRLRVRPNNSIKLIYPFGFHAWRRADIIIQGLFVNVPYLRSDSISIYNKSVNWQVENDLFQVMPKMWRWCHKLRRRSKYFSIGIQCGLRSKPLNAANSKYSNANSRQYTRIIKTSQLKSCFSWMNLHNSLHWSITQESKKVARWVTKSFVV